MDDRVDLTERIAQLEAANAELEAFCYSVAHDLRSPLRAIEGFASLLGRMSEQEASSSRDLLVRIQRSAGHMTEILEELLMLSRNSRQVLARRPVALGHLAHQVLEGLAGEIESRGAVVRIEDLPTYHVDPALMTQVFANLLGNAIKYSRHAKPPIIEVGTVESDMGPAVFVQDNGAGFDMAHAGKLFGVFQRLHTQSEFEGTGVGLAIVKRIVTRHGGRVWAEGEPGRGATFYFSLPATDRVAVQSRGVEMNSGSVSARSECATSDG
jgi:light-regulated signal transduction histidine kinase (bacteriophytochrome)